MESVQEVNQLQAVRLQNIFLKLGWFAMMTPSLTAIARAMRESVSPRSGFLQAPRNNVGEQENIT